MGEKVESDFSGCFIGSSSWFFDKKLIPEHLFTINSERLQYSKAKVTVT